MNPTRQHRFNAVLSGTVIALVVLTPGIILLAKNLGPAMAANIPVYDDPAIIELDTLRATEGDQHLGPYSRMRFRHPGPAMFYALAPLYELGDHTHGSLCIGSIVLTMLWALAIVLTVWSLFGITGAVWSAVSVLVILTFASPYYWASIWNPNVGLLPIVLALVGCAGLALRAWPTLPVLVTAASFAAQAHLVYAMFLALMIAAAVVGASVTRNWGSRVTTGDRRVFRASIGLSAVAGVALWAPVLISPGAIGVKNLIEAIGISFSQSGDWSISTAIGHCSYWLSAAYLAPFGMVARDRIQPAALPLTALLTALQLTVFALVAVVGYRRRSTTHFVLGLLGISSFFITVALATQLAADPAPHLVRWIFVCGPAFASLIISSTLDRRARTSRLVRAGTAAGWTLLLVTGSITAADSLAWMSLRDFIRSGWGERAYAPAWESLEPALNERCSSGSHVRILDDELWPYAAGIFLQLEKTRRTASADPRWGFMFGRDCAAGSPAPDCLTVVARGVDSETVPSSNLVADLDTKHGPLDIRLYSAAVNTVAGVLKVDDASFAHLIESGFSGFEPDDHGGSRWSSGRRSVFNVFLRARVGYRMEFEARAIEAPGLRQTASISLSGTPLGSLPITPTWETHSITIPASAVLDFNRIAIEYDFAISPMELGRSDDRRQLGVKYRSFRFIALEDHDGGPEGR